MLSSANQKASSEGPSTFVDTCESTPYLQTIFQELTPNSKNLDPKRYKVLQYKNENVAAIMKEIDDIIDKQQSSSVFAGEFVIIIHDGTSIEEQVIDHLGDLKVRFTYLSGPGECLILTLTTPPHERIAVFFSTLRDEIRVTMLLDSRSKLKAHLHGTILSALYSWLRVSLEGSQQTQPRSLQMLLNKLRHALTMEIQTILPNIPVPSTLTLDFLLDSSLNFCQLLLPRLLEYERSNDTPLHGQTRRQLNLLSQLKKQLESQLPITPIDFMWDHITRHMAPEELIVPSGSFKIPIYVHSAQTICNRVFSDGEIGTTTNLVEQKKWDAGAHGSKVPNYTIAPHHLYFVRCAQHHPFIPPVMVEVGTDNKAKVLFDCAFTILGTRFQVDAMYGVDLHANMIRKTLEYIDIYYFDISLKALVEIRDTLTGREQAAVSLVIKEKALQKFNDLRALELLREWERNGDNSHDQYQRVLDQIKHLRRRYSLQYAPAPADDQYRTSMSAALRTLQSYQQYGDERLRNEKAYYSGILTQCQKTIDQYKESEGTSTDMKQLVREGEVMLVQKIFERRSLTRVDEHCTESMQFPIKAFTGVELLGKEFISLFRWQLQNRFSQVRMLFSAEALLYSYQTSNDHEEQFRDSSDSDESETSSAGCVRQSSQGPVESRKRDHSSSSTSSERGEGGTLTRALRSGVEIFMSGTGTIGRKLRRLSGMYTSAAQDELPEEVSQCFNRLSNSKKVRVRPYLMRDDVKSCLHDIEWTPAYLRASEDFLSKETYFIEEFLARPRALKVYLEDLAHESDTQGPQSSQSSQNSNEAEHIEYE